METGNHIETGALRYVVFLVAGIGLVSCGTSRPDEAPHPGAGRRVHAGAVWDDPIRCSEAVRAGSRLNRAQFRTRIGTWNLNWFPDGQQKDQAWRGTRTNVGWVACVIAWMDVDLLALQEIKLTERGLLALDDVLAELKGLTGTAWKRIVDTCPVPSRQHVAVLYRPDRVTVSQVVNHPEVDPTAVAGAPDPSCPGELRPALGMYVESKAGGLDFHFVTTQLQDGREQKELTRRRRGWAGLAKVHAQRIALRQDEDFVVAADFSSIGCFRCEAPSQDAEQEILVSTLRGFDRPLRVLDCSEGCTRYAHGKPQRSDQIVVSATMSEARGLSARAVGVCDAARCKKLGPNASLAFSHLSDHCPLIVDLHDRDEDTTAGAATVEELSP
ncbi:MAG: hypothetical protein V3T05_09955 [Myxococcota bacterium]